MATTETIQIIKTETELEIAAITEIIETGVIAITKIEEEMLKNLI